MPVKIQDSGTIGIVQKVLINVLAYADTDDITARQLAVLCSIAMVESWTVRDLAAALGLARPAISRAADAWEEMGFIERQDDPEDRRSVLLVITETGKRYVNTLTR